MATRGNHDDPRRLSTLLLVFSEAMAMRHIEFHLPFPPAELSPNARIDRRAKAPITRQYRQECSRVAKSARVKAGGSWPLEGPVMARYIFIVASRRRRDWVNLYGAFKAGEDGIVDAGLVVDDNAWNLKVELEILLGKEPEVYVELWS